MTRPDTSSTLRTSAELRRAFLKFFEERQHKVVPSSPMIPHGDATMLLTTAGMVQFKPYYTATGDVPYTRAASVQKCLRLTDLENVARTPRHLTFFEMLGNFSFGPSEKGAYFKQEAIAYAWEFVTQVLGLPKERLYASVFEGEGSLPRDDEAIALWKKIGLSESHIVPLGRKDNFWGPAGGAGACGPCSEIYFDLGERRPDYLAEGEFWGERPGDPGDRFMEFWNLVFPQFDAQADGVLKPLPRPGIDTGMGLERLALIAQEKRIVFETDTLQRLVDVVLTHRRSDESPTPSQVSDARVVADHVRALTFAIGEGAVPGNEGAGYVLRRLLRRAVARMRASRGLAIQDLVLPVLARNVVELFGDSYPELGAHTKKILDVLAKEESQFGETFEAGLKRLQDLMSDSSAISGTDLFLLHDTYGFPIELTEEIAAERGVTVDRAGFESAMDEQRQRARAASKFSKTGDATRAAWTEVTSGRDSEFLGYAALEADGLTLRRWRSADDGEIDMVLDRTPCYAESGGQVSDRGWIGVGETNAELIQVSKEGDSIVHRVRAGGAVAEQLISAGAAGKLRAVVNPAHRFPTQRHHTATHLLHAVLRQTLGTHVKQAGSLVAPDRLRFDYTHFEAPSKEQLAQMAHEINEWVLRNREVTWRIMPIDEAKGMGAMALFGEKYGAEVRMVTVEAVDEAGIPTSRELCGGTHVTRTGDIGAFAIVSEGAIASGVRRIEALCGHEAMTHLHAQAETLARAAAALQASPAVLVEQIEKLKAEGERLKKAQAELQRGGLEDEMAKLAEGATQAAGGRWLVAEIKSSADANAVRDAADQLRGQLKRGALVLAVQGDGKLMFLAAVSDDLVAEKRLRADELVRAVAKVTGGSGGGKPHLALAGGKDLTKVAEALDEARRLLAQALST